MVADAQTRGVPITANAAGPGAQALIEAYHLLAVRLMGQKGFVTGSNEVQPTARAGFGRLLGKLRK